MEEVKEKCLLSLNIDRRSRSEDPIRRSSELAPRAWYHAPALHRLYEAPINPPSDVELRSESTALARRSSQATVSWTFGGNKLLNFGVFIVNAFVFTSVCVASATISCAIAAAFVVYTSLFYKYSSNGRRSAESFDVNDLGADSEMYLTLPPTPEKSHIQRLSTELEPGLWHEVGHMRVGMFNHTIHYYNHGSNIHTVRAWQRNFVRNGRERSDQPRSENDNDGTVVDYSWKSTNEQVYDDFDSFSASTSYFAANSMGYMIETASGIAACADFADQEGDMDEAVLTIGWNDQPFQWTERSCPGDVQWYIRGLYHLRLLGWLVQVPS
ncbi:hypothetical protein PHLCEN_2v10150 [Hermanssonia centrifuga]|uniref:Uncharacterized protein n=1 Tax=Hermanssonia centrifuga TaxID=98765 RepID=A0A2R6NNX7_9APHY|nr:hypothetical protein PHLCEN_2v10150 [Hermanssonia centrifuga]